MEHFEVTYSGDYKAKKYPDATLILAHAARSFAPWTAIESIDKIGTQLKIADKIISITATITITNKITTITLPIVQDRDGL